MPKACDVLFVDTSHSTEQTLAELTCYMPRVKPGGIALFHDIQWLYPNISLPEVGGPVAAALDFWCDRNGMSWESRLSGPGYYGLGTVKVPQVPGELMTAT